MVLNPAQGTSAGGAGDGGRAAARWQSASSTPQVARARATAISSKASFIVDQVVAGLTCLFQLAVACKSLSRTTEQAWLQRMQPVLCLVPMILLLTVMTRWPDAYHRHR